MRPEYSGRCEGAVASPGPQPTPPNLISDNNATRMWSGGEVVFTLTTRGGAGAREPQSPPLTPARLA